MCWCLNLCFGVLSNLTGRILTDLSDAAYKMCHFCCCSSREYIKDVEELVKEAREEFYKELSRESTEDLLANKQNGTFIIRPAKNSTSIGTLSVVQDDKIFHLSIRNRKDGLVSLGSEKSNEKCFRNVDSLINYYISNYLVLYSDGVTSLTLLLPYRDNKVIL